MNSSENTKPEHVKELFFYADDKKPTIIDWGKNKAKFKKTLSWEDDDTDEEDKDE